MVATLAAAPNAAAFDITDCLDRVRRGEQEAARALVERFYPLVRRLVHAHRPASVAEEDLAQDSFLTLFSRLDRYAERPGIPFEHWLARLTVNVCRDALRQERRRVRTASVSPEALAWLESLVTDAGPRADDALGAHQAVELLLSELPPGDRLVLTLLHLEEQSVEQIARVTGWSRAGIKVRAFRARRRLRAAAGRLTGSSETSDD
jgi:RNA polymerase sigma-70 factor (ECF subfamily)